MNTKKFGEVIKIWKARTIHDFSYCIQMFTHFPSEQVGFPCSSKAASVSDGFTQETTHK